MHISPRSWVQNNGIGAGIRDPAQALTTRDQWATVVCPAEMRRYMQWTDCAHTRLLCALVCVLGFSEEVVDSVLF